MEKENVILHVTLGDNWDKAKTGYYYFPDSLKKEGFISCATHEQVLRSAEFLYKDKLNQKLLYINPEEVKAPVVYEDIHEMGHSFPHIYGALNLDAVIKVIDFKPDSSGIFELPYIS
jgi:uncharacterized protein (DUF952 family)